MLDLSLLDELAETGRLKLSPEERVSFLAELDEQLDVIRQLDVIPLEKTIRPVIHGNPYPPEIRCELREDEWIPFESPEKIIAQAPLSRDGCIVSPDNTSEKLEIRNE